LKNRAGKAGKVLNGVSFNNGTCRISTDNVEEYDGLLAIKQKKDKDSTDFAKIVMEKMNQKKS
jgi:hypothetical protein